MRFVFPPRAGRRTAARFATFLTVCLTWGACARATRGAAVADAPAGMPARDGWRPLLDGASLDAWRGYRGGAIPPGWALADGVLTRHGATGDLVTREEFGDFELAWEWKISTGGDAGVFYRGTEAFERIYWTGIEYQLEDDAHPVDGPSRLAASGAVYGLYPVRPGVVRPAGEWNTSRIVARGAHVEHWLNGERVAVYELGSPDWTARVGASKFARWPAYGRALRGHLAIQGDHDCDLAIRAMRVRALS
ncbi:MAG TPA: DUF1080 domain-containing protein [Gemmatirosa sp.]